MLTCDSPGICRSIFSASIIAVAGGVAFFFWDDLSLLFGNESKSAAVPAGDPFLDHERVVFDWPDAGARLIEEMR